MRVVGEKIEVEWKNEWISKINEHVSRYSLNPKS